MCLYFPCSGAPPTLIQPPKDKTVAEHKDTDFTCLITGGPRPEIYWTKGKPGILNA